MEESNIEGAHSFWLGFGVKISPKASGMKWAKFGAKISMLLDAGMPDTVTWTPQSQQWHLSSVKQTLMTFHYTDWFIGILILSYYNQSPYN